MSRRALAAVAVAAALVGVACGGGRDDAGRGPTASDPASPSGPTTTAEDWIARSDSDAVFSVDCAFSHRAPDDPIVAPGRPGASHGHDFFGSAATDADSTGASLLGTPTSCREPADTAAYWVPTLSLDGVPVDPAGLRAYYRAAVGTDVRDVVAPPAGLAMISGDPTGGTGGHDHDGGTDDGHDGHDAAAPAARVDAGWGCGLRPRRLSATPPDDCVVRSPLTLHLRFPDCWDGSRLDSDDHRSHVTNSVDGACPASHPVLMTEVQLSIWWPVAGADAARVELASGPVDGAHGDFLNGWDPDALARQVELCVHAKANCTIA